MMKLCKFCNIEPVKTKKNVFCSNSCSASYRVLHSNNSNLVAKEKTTTHTKCKECSKDMFLPLWKSKINLFCSNSCSSKYNMNKTETGEVIKERLQSKEVREKANKTYRSEKYRKERSIISKETSNRPHVKKKSKETMLKLHKKIHNDPEWSEKMRKCAKSRILSGKFGPDSHEQAGFFGGFMGGIKSKHKRTGILMRSNWEILFANLCDENNLKWEYEPKRFNFGWTSYRPDFKINNKYIDVKPKLRLEKCTGTRLRFEKLKTEFKSLDIPLILLDKSEFKKFFENNRKQL